MHCCIRWLAIPVLTLIWLAGLAVDAKAQTIYLSTSPGVTYYTAPSPVVVQYAVVPTYVLPSPAPVVVSSQRLGLATTRTVTVNTYVLADPAPLLTLSRPTTYYLPATTYYQPAVITSDPVFVAPRQRVRVRY
jgi:hypothetical protein